MSLCSMDERGVESACQWGNRWRLMKERKTGGERSLGVAVSEEGLIENCKREIQWEQVDDERNVERMNRKN